MKKLLVIPVLVGSLCFALMSADTNLVNFKPQVEIITDSTHRIFKCNAIPAHSVGKFPNKNNPNRIRPQKLEFRVPLHPTDSEKPIELTAAMFGVALNGVPFEPNANEFWNNNPRSGWSYDALRAPLGFDEHHAHVQPTGKYHYHGSPTGLILNNTKMTLLGYAADGYPIYHYIAHSTPTDTTSELREFRSSYRLKTGSRPNNGPKGNFDGTYVEDYQFVEGSGDLDEFNGLFLSTDEYPEGIYAYMITREFPYISRKWKAKPDSSFMFGPPERPMHGGPGGPPKPGHWPPGDRPPPPGR